MRFCLFSCLSFIEFVGANENVQAAEIAEKPLVKPIILIAHRGGKPDNTLEAIEHSIGVGVTAVEIDLRMTLDERIVLSHELSIPKSKFFPDIATDEKIVIAKTKFDMLSSLRFREEIKGKKFIDLHLPSFDEVLQKYLKRVNLDLHIGSETSLDVVCGLLDKYDAWNRVIIHSDDIAILKKVREKKSDVRFLWPQPVLGRHEVDGKLIPLPLEEQKKVFRHALDEFSKIGGGILCVKVLSPELTKVCHEYGILVMPSSNQVKDGTAEEWLKSGADVIMGDSPENMRKGVERVLGPEYLPKGNRNIVDILREISARQ